MPIIPDYLAYELPAKPKQPIEYIVVTIREKQGKVLLHTFDHHEAQKLATKIRAAGGAVTVFRSTKL